MMKNNFNHFVKEGRYIFQHYYLQNEEVTEVPHRHEALFTELPYFLFIKLNASIKCIFDAFHYLSFQVIPEICIRSMKI